MTVREWLTRLQDRFRRTSLDQDLADELQFHRDRLEKDGRADGLNDRDARSRANRKLGSDLRVREGSREYWSLPGLDAIEQDVRYALRGLRRAPGFTATVVITLGLGIGANVAMFGILDRLMFAPLPYLNDPSSVNRVYLQTTPRGQTFTNTVFPYTRFLDLRKASSSFSQSAAFSEQIMAIGVGDDARERYTAAVSESFFAFFDVQPFRGRFFASSELSETNPADVVVVAHSYWQSNLGGRDVIGEQLRVGSRSYTVIGVAPKGFVGANERLSPSAFIPLPAFALNEGGGNGKEFTSKYNWDFAQILVRRKPGVSEKAASGDLTQAYIRSRDAQRLIVPTVAPANVAHPVAVAGPLKTAAGPGANLEARTLLWVSGVALVVFLIACANVTNLVLARMLKRKREFAMRLALGVSRQRLIGQLVTENAVLATSGLIVAFLVAYWGNVTLTSLLLPTDASTGLPISVRGIAVGVLIALVATLLISVGAAIATGRGNLSAMLRAGAREGTFQRSRLRSSLLVLQGALSVLLLVGAGLFVRSLVNARSTHLGYDSAHVLMAFPNMRGVRLDSGNAEQLNRNLLTAAQTIPGVVTASRINSRLFSTNSELVFVEGMDSTAHLGRFVIQYSSPEYFSTMGTRILRGRAFTDADRSGTERVTVVSESMGRILWPGRDAIGQCLRIREKTAPCATVIGIAEDATYTGLLEQKRFAQYVPIAQSNVVLGRNIVLRMQGTDAARSSELVRRELQKVLPGDAYVTVKPVEEFLAVERRSWTLGATMFVAFGALALIVAAVGLYGVIMYNVAQRMHELGVRVALGAQSRDIMRLVLGQGVSFALVGVAIGLACAAFAARWIEPLLFKQPGRDPAVYALVSGTLILVAIVASALPATRASRADPNNVLRSN